MNGKSNAADDELLSETRERGSQHDSEKKLIGNVAGVFAANVAQRGSALTVYVLVGRILGAHEFGRLAIAVTLLFAWHTCFLLGMQTYLSREIVKNFSKMRTSFANAFFVGFISSVVGVLLVFPVCYLLGYSPATRSTIFALFAGLTPFVLIQVCEAVFQGTERMARVSWIVIPVSVLKVLVTGIVLNFGWGINAVAFTLAGCYWLVLILELAVLVCTECPYPWRSFKLSAVPDMLRGSMAFFGIQAGNSVKGASIILLLSLSIGETAVGVYAAAVQLLSPVLLCFSSVAFGVFPALCRGTDRSKDKLANIVQLMLEGMLSIALPATIGLCWLGLPILLMLYENADFESSLMVLRIIAWSLIFQACTSILGQLLWAGSSELVAFRITLLNTLILCLLGVMLISLFGLVGAAVATLLAAGINFLQHLRATTGYWSVSGFGEAIRFPAIGCAGMLAYLSFGSDQHPLVAIGGAALVYLFVLTLLWGMFRNGIQKMQALVNRGQYA